MKSSDKDAVVSHESAFSGLLNSAIIQMDSGTHPRLLQDTAKMLILGKGFIRILGKSQLTSTYRRS